MESRFGHDLSGVRVHSGAVAAQSARDLGAPAYTVGSDIAFGAGQYAPATVPGRRLLAHELAHTVQQRHATANGPLQLGGPGDLAEHDADRAASRVMAGQDAALPRARADAVRVVRRGPGPGAPRPPTPPAWLGRLGATATHLVGDLWDVRIRGLGMTPIGPHDQMQSYLRGFNQTRLPGVEAMESAHIVGGEHMRDLGWEMAYKEAPAIGVAKSLHDKWTREISNLQSKSGPMGGRATPTVGRPIVGPRDVKSLLHEVYRGFPDLQKISKRIVDLEARRIMAAKYGMPKPKSPMDAHKGGMPKPVPPIPRPVRMPEPQSPMDAHKGGMPKPESPMNVPRGGEMPRPQSPMDAHQGGMPKPQAPMDAHQGGMPKSQSPMDAHQGGGMPKPAPQSPMEAHKGGMPKPQSPMDAHKGGMPKPGPVPKPPGFWKTRFNVAKTSIAEGVKGAFSASSLISMVPVLVLGIADRIAAREAIKAIQVKFIKEGFAKGMAAAVVRWSEEEVNGKLKNRVTPFRIEGMEDPAGILTRDYLLQLAEVYENYAVDVGYAFGSTRSVKWKDWLRNKGFKVLAKNEYGMAEPEFLFTYHFINDLAWAIAPTTNPIVENAIKEN